jgi:hypothetical protein
VFAGNATAKSEEPSSDWVWGTILPKARASTAAVTQYYNAISSNAGVSFAPPELGFLAARVPGASAPGYYLPPPRGEDAVSGSLCGNSRFSAVGNVAL